MRKTLYIIGLSTFVFSCTSQQNVKKYLQTENPGSTDETSRSDTGSGSSKTKSYI